MCGGGGTSRTQIFWCQNLVDQLLISIFLSSLGDDELDDDIERRISRQGPKQKSFSDLGAKQKRKATQKVYDSLKEVSESRQIEPVQMTGYILKRYFKTYKYMKISTFI